MSADLHAQAIALATGLLLITAVLMVWRRSITASTRLLAVQGAALAGLVAVLGVAEGGWHLLVVAVVVAVVKAGLLPWLLQRTVLATHTDREDLASVNPVSGLLMAALLTTVAYLVSAPVTMLGAGPSVGSAAGTVADSIAGGVGAIAAGAGTAKAVPAGIALVLIGFWLIITRRRAASQLIGFLVVDNGVAAVAFLASGGVPLLVELGVSLDVVLVVLILRVLSARIAASEVADLHDLQELRD